MPTHPSHHDSGNGPAGTTRTRLPEGGYATPRRPPARISRTLVTVVGIIVLLIAALAFATRGGSGSAAAGSPGTGGSTTGSSAGTAPSAAPTTPTGTPPVTTTTSGIPTGYPHTPQGAQSAAANYAVALGGTGMFEAESRHRIVATLYASSVVTRQQAQFDAAYTNATFLKRLGLTAEGAAPSGMTFISRPDPVGTRMDTYATGNTTVEVWYSSLFGLAGTGSTTPVEESWYTDTFRMSWSGGDWKVVTLGQKDGPAPVGHDQAASSAQAMIDAVNGFGGLTYAR